MKRMVCLPLLLLMLWSTLPVASANNLERVELLDAANFADWYYTNPSEIVDIGDPQIVAAEGTYWLFATSSSAGFCVWHSDDLVHWEKQQKLAYKMGPKTWGNASFWAPEVYAYNGKYYMFYSAKRKASTRLCLGVAVAEHPAGPYLDISEEPFYDPGYSVIDATFFVDDNGDPYLFFSRDCSENIIDGIHESHIYGAKLHSDLTAIDGEPVLLTQPDQTWEYASGSEWRWNEGPVVEKVDGKYWLFYSANFYAGKEYGVGAASAEHPLGPYEKYGDNPLLSYVDQDSKTLVSGPGHNSLLTLQDGERFMVYHTHHFPIAPSGDRQMAFDRYGFHTDGTPYVNGPTIAPQLRPLSSLGLYNPLQNAVVTGGEPNGLTSLIDGDYGVSSASTAYAWRPQNTENAWVCFDFAEDTKIEAVLLYAAPGTRGTVRVIFDEQAVAECDMSIVDELPGGCIRLHFAPRDSRSLRIEWDQTVTIYEVVALASH